MDVESAIMTNVIVPFLISLCLALAGCQEDLGRSAAAGPAASYTAEQREQRSLAILKQTLGQPDPAATTTTGTKASARRVVAAVPEPTRPLIPRPTLSWIPPATREDGSRLAVGEIRGYRLYFRLRHQDRFDALTLEGPDATRFSLAALPPGAYEFSVTTVDQAGLESRRSEPVVIDLI